MIFFKPKFWDEKQISILAILLLPLSLIIKFLSLIKKLSGRNKKYSIPIICVGNIYVGGTGKTPFCTELYSILKSLNKNPIFIRKKYDKFKDEIELLKKIGPIYEDSKRTGALEQAIKNKFEVAILDDGFQDFSIKKDLSIICFTEKQWVGNGLTIPSGPLREGLSALSRADYVIINGKKNIDIEKEILKKNKLIKIFYSEYVAQNINDFKDKKVICFAGIGNPNNFFELLKKYQLDVLEKLSFPDHYNYSKEELDDLSKKALEHNAILLTTEKDYLRINEKSRQNISFLKIRVDIKNKEKLVEELKKVI